MDKRLAWMVIAFGALVIAGGVIGYTKGSTVSLLTAGPMGLVVALFGVLGLRRAPWSLRTACIACAAGLLVIALGGIGYAQGSAVSLLTAGPVGLAVVLLGVLGLRPAPWARRAACIACATVAAVMLSRLLQTGHVLPGAPVAALGLALAAVLFRNDRPAT